MTDPTARAVILPVYRRGEAPGLERPVSWREDEAGYVSQAVLAYCTWRTASSAARPPSEEDQLVLWAYLRYFIQAPCWRARARDARVTGDLGVLIVQAYLGLTLEDVERFLVGCLALGVDPL